MADVYYIRLPDGSSTPPIPASIPREEAMRRLNDMMDAQESSLPARAGASFLQGLVQSIPDFTGGLVSRRVREEAPPAIQQLTGVNPEQPPPPRSTAEPYILSAARGAGTGVAMAPAGLGALASGMLTGAAGGATGELAARGIQGLGGEELAQTGARLVGEIAGGAGAGALQRGVARTAVAPLTAADITPDPGIARRVETLMQEGIPVRPSQLTGSPMRTRIEQGFGDIFSTTGREQDINREIQNAFNAAVLRRAGITPEVMERAGTTGPAKASADLLKFQERELGKKINEIAGRNVAVLDQGVIGRLMNLEDDARNFATEDVSKIIRNSISELLAKSKDGVVQGQAWRELDSRIGQRIGDNTNGDIIKRLSELRSIMRDALASGVKNETDLTALNDARRQYANLVTIENAMGTGAMRATGAEDIAPTALRGALLQSQGPRAMAKERPDLAPLARAGSLLTSPLANSQTASRAQMISALQLGGLGAAGGASLGEGAASALGGLVASQVIPKVLQSAYYGLPGTTRMGVAGPTATNISQGLLGTTPARGAALGAIQAAPQAEELSEEAMRSALAQNAMQRMRGLLQ